MEQNISELKLSKRSINALCRNNIFTFSDLMRLTEKELLSMKGVGKNTILEIISFQKLNNLNFNTETSESHTILDEILAEKEICKYIKKHPFCVVEITRLCNKINGLSEDICKIVLDKLVEKRFLFDVDSGYTLIYPRVQDVVLLFEPKNISDLDRRNLQIFTLCLDGKRDVDIAKMFNMSRTNVSICKNKILRKLKALTKRMYGVGYFEEERWAKLYKEYNLSNDFLQNALFLDDITINYLKSFFQKGKRNIDTLLTDKDFNIIYKKRINDYLTKNKILVEKDYINVDRNDIIVYVLSTGAQQDISYDCFCKIYNAFLQKYCIGFCNKLCICDKNKRRYESIISQSKSCLWKQGKMLRYYDIKAHDYERLFNELDLNSYSNIKISTKVLYNKHREVMSLYDLHDEYELHNLLRKICSKNTYPLVDFGRMPMLIFEKEIQNT